MKILVAILITLVFFLSGINKVKNFDGVRKSIQKKFIISTLPVIFYKMILVLVIMLEILAPFIIIYSATTHTSKNAASIACYALALFTVLATMMYHPPNKKKEYHHFMKNLSIIGGLLALSNFFI